MDYGYGCKRSTKIQFVWINNSILKHVKNVVYDSMGEVDWTEEAISTNSNLMERDIVNSM